MNVVFSLVFFVCVIFFIAVDFVLVAPNRREEAYNKEDTHLLQPRVTSQSACLQWRVEALSDKGMEYMSIKVS